MPQGQSCLYTRCPVLQKYIYLPDGFHVCASKNFHIDAGCETFKSCRESTQSWIMVIDEIETNYQSDMDSSWLCVVKVDYPNSSGGKKGARLCATSALTLSRATFLY